MNLSRIKKTNWSYYIMLLPAFLLVLVYHYGPIGGLALAFQKYNFAESIFNQEWVGLENFRYIFGYPGFTRALWNTLFIAIMKLTAHFIVPITVSILLNEVRKVYLKRYIQTLIYLPHFMSWVIISSIFIDILSPSEGIVNKFLGLAGIEPVYFLGEPKVFPFTVVATDIWKEFGFRTIVYFAALSSIDPNLYEAAEIDGAKRMKKIRHITIPGIMPIIVLLGTLSLGRILNAGFEQIFNMYNPLVYSTGDILDTLTYRIGIVNNEYDIATAIGLFRSIVSLLLVSTSYYMASKLANYRIF